MLVYAVPSHANYYPDISSTLYLQPPSVPFRITGTRQRYLRALADAQLARESYLRELEEQRLLDSLAQAEALRQAQLHRAAIRQRQVQNGAARRCAGFGFGRCGSYAEPLFAGRTTEQRAAHPVGQHQEQLQALEEFLSSLIGINAEAVGEDRSQNQTTSQSAHANQAGREELQTARTSFFEKLDSIRKEAPAGCDPCAARKHSLCSLQSQDEAPTSFPQFVPLSRRAEIPRAHDRAARIIQRQWRSHSADNAARRDALHTIDLLRSRFHFLRNTFTFPEHLEFKTQEAGNADPALAYSSLNAGVHSYTNELTKLIMQADGVPSGGSKRVRDFRKAFVQDVEEELQSVETRVKKVWGKRAEVSVVAREDISTSRTKDVGQDIEAHATADPASNQEASDSVPPLNPVQLAVNSVTSPVETPSQEDSHSQEEEPSSKEVLDGVVRDPLSVPEGDSNALETNIVKTESSVPEHHDYGDEKIETLADEQQNNLVGNPSEAIPISFLTAAHPDNSSADLGTHDTGLPSASDSPASAEPFDIVNTKDSRPATPSASFEHKPEGDAAGAPKDAAAPTPETFAEFDIVYPDSPISARGSDVLRTDDDLKDDAKIFDHPADEHVREDGDFEIL